MAFAYHYRHWVTFAETDMAGIVHFSNFFRYMENAEHAFLRQLGLSAHMTIDDRTISWPRVGAECHYHAPLVFEDELNVYLRVRKKTRKSITYGFIFRVREHRVADGSLTVVCVAIGPEAGQMTATEIPASIDEKIDVAPDGPEAPNGREARETDSQQRRPG